MEDSQERLQGNAKPGAARFAALWLAVLPCACGSTLPRAWTDERLGFAVHTDFPPQQVRILLQGEPMRKIGALCELFEVDSLPDLRVFVHDHGAVALDNGGFAAGWHDGVEIHVLASRDGLDLHWPDADMPRVLGHEFVHALLRRTGRRPPRWLEEGLCEVLAASPIAADDALVPMPDLRLERALEQMRDEGHCLPADRLLALVDDYPEGGPAMAAMYAQGASFAYWCMGERKRVVLADVDAVLQQSPQQRRDAYDRWAAAVSVPLAIRLLQPLAHHPEAAVRRALADGLGAPGNDAWWQAATLLLLDDDVHTRQAARLCALCRPAGAAQVRARFETLRDRDELQLHRAGLVALGQCGDLDAALAFCRSLAGEVDNEWWQPLLWLDVVVPAEGGAPKPTFVAVHTLDQPGVVAGAARAIAARIGRLRPRLVWNARQLRYVLQ